VGDHQRGTGRREVLHPAQLGAEPALVEQPQQRVEDGVGQLRVEPELVHLVGAGQPPPQKRQPGGEPAVPYVHLLGHPLSLPCPTGAQRRSRRTPARTARSTPASRSAERTPAGTRPRKKSANASAVVRGVTPYSLVNRVVSTTRPWTNRSTWSRPKPYHPGRLAIAAAEERPDSTTGSGTRPARRIACERRITPGPATLYVPG